MFRAGRLGTTAEWKTQVEAARVKFETLFNLIGDLGPGGFTKATVALAFTERLLEALRYLAAPPVSEDDLQTIADVPSLAASVITADPDELAKVHDVLKAVIDPYRFPWVADGRKPTDQERSAALLASAVLLASQRVQTDRRNRGKTTQEQRVKDFLKNLGFAEVKPAAIATLVSGPQAGQFCGECKLGSRKGDVIVRLHDTRLMPCECKVSNSETNSVKRVVNDAAAKATSWNLEYGLRQVVPAAVIGGCFNPRNLLQAQDAGLTIFWAHDLAKLGEFIATTRPA
ncbi:MAG: XamI family restriction endonuclease [Verrucomicrobia bacterium]|nr:XamI family restriction endonuclease [Verrucomicrobiota bacterium]